MEIINAIPKMRLIAGKDVLEQFKDEVSVITLGECLVKYHVGPYEILEESYEEIKDFIKKKGYIINGNIIETPIINSFIVSNEEEYLTEIKVPVKEKINNKE